MISREIVNYFIKEIKEWGLEAEIASAIDDKWEELLKEDDLAYQYEYVSVLSKILSNHLA